MFDWDALHDWMDKFHDDVVEGKRRIRGFIFCGMHLETHSRDEVVINLHPGVEGNSPEDRANSFLKEVFDDYRYLSAFVPIERMKKIIVGQDCLAETDWVWSDEH